MSYILYTRYGTVHMQYMRISYVLAGPWRLDD